VGYLPQHEVIGERKQPLAFIIYTGEERMKVYSSLLCTFITQDYAKDNLTFALQYLTLNYTLSWKHMPLRLSIVQIKSVRISSTKENYLLSYNHQSMYSLLYLVTD